MRVAIPKGRTPPDWVYDWKKVHSVLVHRENVNYSHLLDARYMPRNVFYSNGIFDGQSVGLALDARFIDQNATVCCET